MRLLRRRGITARVARLGVPMSDLPRRMAPLPNATYQDSPFWASLEKYYYSPRWLVTVKVGPVGSPATSNYKVYEETRVIFSGVDTVNSRYDNIRIDPRPDLVVRGRDPTLRQEYRRLESHLLRLNYITYVPHSETEEIQGFGYPVTAGDLIRIEKIRPGQWKVTVGGVEESPRIFCQEAVIFAGTGLTVQGEHYGLASHWPGATPSSPSGRFL